MAEFLPGAPVAERLTQDLKARSDALRQRGVTPTLAIIRALSSSESRCSWTMNSGVNVSSICS